MCWSHWDFHCLLRVQNRRNGLPRSPEHQSGFGRVGLGIRRMNLGDKELQETGDVTFNCPFEGGASVVGGTMMIELL